MWVGGADRAGHLVMPSIDTSARVIGATNRIADARDFSVRDVVTAARVAWPSERFKQLKHLFDVADSTARVAGSAGGAANSLY